MIQVVAPAHNVPALLLAALALVACGTATSAVGSSSASRPAGAALPSATEAPAPSSPTATFYTFAPEPGSSINGTVPVASSASGAPLTATLQALKPGVSYIVDAEHNPACCLLANPAKSAMPFVADANGNATLAWSTPSGMDGNASVQEPTAHGPFTVIACAGLTP
jgi:hypothetical protein